MSVVRGEAQCHAHDKERPLTGPPSSATPSRMSSVNSAPARALLGQSAFLCFLGSRCLSRFASQIAAVAIGWQVYDLTGRAFDLGIVGLVQFLPTAILLFMAGQAADRFERKKLE